MELRHLRYFIAVAEEQNVSRAAARLRVAQPSLSRQIRDLEDILGLALFERSAKAIRLTDGGLAFLHEARAVVQRTEEAMEVARAIATGRSGVLHVGFAPSLTVEILPRALRHFQQSCPGVRVQLHDLSTQEMIERLKNGKLQVALMIQASARELSGIVFEPLRRYAVCVAAHPAHPILRARKVGLAEVARERLIAYTRADYPEYHAWLSRLYASRSSLPVIAEEHDSSTSLIASVEAGRGIALVQRGFECLAGSRLTIHPLSPKPPPFVVGIARRKDARSASIDHFLAAARSLEMA